MGAMAAVMEEEMAVADTEEEVRVAAATVEAVTEVAMEEAVKAVVVKEEAVMAEAAMARRKPRYQPWARCESRLSPQ